MRRVGLLAFTALLALAAAPAGGESSAPPAGSPWEARAPWPPLQVGASSDSAPPPAPPMPGDSAGGESVGRPVAAPPPPTLGAAGFRAVGATAVVAVLLTVTLLVLPRLFRQAGRSAPSRLGRGPGKRGSWLSRWMPASGSAADGLEILERRYVGAKESICIVRAGAERFLIGVTTSGICLLGRLEPARESADEAEEPGAVDFAHALPGPAVPRPSPTDGAFHALLTRSRERLTRLGVDSGHAGARRE